MSNAEDLDLVDVGAELWRQKRKILVVVVAAATSSFFYALSLPNFYTSHALLAPRVNDSGGLGAIAGQVGGIASLAGISLGNTGSPDTMVALETLRSKTFFRERVYEKILPELMAAKEWIAEEDNLVFLDGNFDPKTRTWRTKPSSYAAHKKFVGRHLRSSHDKGTGLVTLGVEHESPVVAKRWTEILVGEVNESLRAKAVGEANSSITFLQQQLAKSTLVNVNETLSILIEEQFRTIMLANATEEYVFKIIDEPIMDPVPSSPKRSQIITVATVVGFIFSTLFFLSRYLFRRFIRKEK